MFSKIKSLIIAAIALSILTGNVLAHSYTWEEVVEITKLHNHPSLAKARKSAGYAEMNYYKAFSAFLPQFSATAAAVQSDSPTEDNTYSYSFSGTLSLFNGWADLSNRNIKKRS